MSHILNSLNGGYLGGYIRKQYRVTQGDTQTVDSGSYAVLPFAGRALFLIYGIAYKET